MNILDCLDQFFTQHIFLQIALSGIGITILIGIVKLLIFTIRAIQKHASQKELNEPLTTSNTTYITPSDTVLKEDIQNIRHSISSGFRSRQEQTFLCYYHKYKDKISPKDAEMLYTESQGFYPDYTKLLCCLVGLLEILDD